MELTPNEKFVLRNHAGNRDPQGSLDYASFSSAQVSLVYDKKLMEFDKKRNLQLTSEGRAVLYFLDREEERLKEAKTVAKVCEVALARQDNDHQITDIMQRISMMSTNGRLALLKEIDNTFDRLTGDVIEHEDIHPVPSVPGVDDHGRSPDGVPVRDGSS